MTHTGEQETTHTGEEQFDINSLLLIDTNDKEKIHIDVFSNEFSESPLIRTGEMWGEYNMKPKCQTMFEEMVNVAAVEIASTQYTDIRPKAQDRLSGKMLLIDSGAAASCWPVAQFPHAQLDQKNLYRQ